MGTYAGPALGNNENGPCMNAAAVTPHDTTDLTYFARALFVGTGGDVVAVMLGDASAITFKNVASGSVLPIACRRVNDTGTTASDIVALW